MKKVKGFFKIVVVLILGTSVLVFFSLRGEENYLENCKTLSLDCEKGRVQNYYEKFKSLISESYHETIENSDASVEESQIKSISDPELDQIN